MTHEEFESIAALDAIGAATAEEQQALQAHLESCVDCRHVRDEYTEAATVLARGLDPIAPPASVRNHVLDAIESDDSETSDNVVEMPRNPIVSRRWLATAAGVFLLLWGWREMSVRVARENLQSRQADIARLRDENNLLAQKNEKLNAEMASLAEAGTKTIALTGQAVAPAAAARVFLEPGKRRALVFFTNLPANAVDKSYQLWILRADQPKPQSAGVFDVSASGSSSIVIENLPVDTEIKGLAVTLEPKGGVAQPTNTNFYVAGNV